MKAVDLRANSEEELVGEIQSLLRAELGARVRKANQSLTNFASLRALRRDIARVRCILHEKRKGIRQEQG